MLAYAIYNYNVAGNPQINLKGIAVGNGCIGHSAGHCGRDPTGLNALHDVEMIRGHGAMSRDLYNTIISACSSNWAVPTPACRSALDMVDIGDIDVYDFYNTCSDPAMTRRLRAPLEEDGLLARLLERRAQKVEALGLPPDPNCFSTTASLEAYMNQPEVKAALNVAADIDWAVCDNNGTFAYRRDYADERTIIYPTLINDAKIEVLIYNGEADLCVPYTDNESVPHCALALALALASLTSPARLFLRQVLDRVDELHGHTDVDAMVGAGPGRQRALRRGLLDALQHGRF